MSFSSLFYKRPSDDDARRVGDQRLRFMRGASDKIRLVVLAVIIGILAGAAAALLKWLIDKVTTLLHPLFITEGPDWTLLWLPVVGILLAGIYQRYILRDRISHGVDKLVNDLAAQKYLLSPKLTYAPTIASTFTLAFGGSAGSEGPIAYTGAAIGSNVGRICGVPAQMIYLLIACGAGAGIAGIFKAPVGGALFTIEVLGMALTTVSVIALFASTISAAMTAYVLSGCTLDIPWHHNILFEPSMLLWATVLGVFCGLYSVYYSVVMKTMRRVYQSIRSPWIENITSGAVLAVTLFMFPSLYGEGYGVIGDIINTDWVAPFDASLFNGGISPYLTFPMILGGVLLVKCFACSASNSGGGVAGDFAPTLFAGCIAGMFFSVMVNDLLGVGLAPQVFAYIGMAGVMAGVIRAPLMALFLTAEMCNGFDYFLPLTVVAMISFGIVMLVTKRKFYEVHLHFSRHHRDSVGA